MEAHLRSLTWNCRRATQNSLAWNYLCELAPDVALLQEVSSLPASIEREFDVRHKRAGVNTGAPQRFGSAVLVRGKIAREIPLQTPYDWVNAELERFAGNLLAFEVLLEQGMYLNIVDVYSPAWPVDSTRLVGVDVSPVKLTLGRGLWVADLPEAPSTLP